MTELWLKYTDENGAPKKVLVRGEKFFIGRYPENDLSIPRSELSRRHAEIDRFDDVYVISDNNSSNGTSVNGRQVERPTALSNGDRINFGGGVEVVVELTGGNSSYSASEVDFQSSKSDIKEPETSDAAALAAENETIEQSKIAAQVSGGDLLPEIVAPSAPVVAADPAAASVKAPAQPQSSMMKIIFIAAPILVIFILVFAGGLLLLLGGGKEKEIARNTERNYGDDFNDKPNKNKREENKQTNSEATPKTENSPSPTNSSTPLDTNSALPISTPKTSGENDKIERTSYQFMRRIANADQNPVLTSQQVNLVNSKIKSFGVSSALQGNLQDLKRKAADIEALAKSKSLKPQFLAAAALAELNGTRGDPLAAAREMAGALNLLSNTISNDLSSDSLIIVAAYSEDKTGASKMPSKLANLSVKYKNESPQTIRSIWFLHDKNQITEQQFEFALRFLAIGAIMQNPKDFGINAEPVVY